LDLVRRIGGILSLAVGAESADLGSGDFDLKSQRGFDLIAEILYRIAKELLDGAALEADHVGVSPLQARLVVVLFAFVVQQVEFVDQAFLFQYFERAVNRDAIDLGIALLSQLEQLVGVEMPVSVVDDFKQQLTLPGEPNSMGLQRRS
jgi:hypothetical protein